MTQERTTARVMRAYKALRVTGRVASLMHSQGLKAAAGAVNPALLAVDAALAVLDAGQAYFRFSAERERTRQLEGRLKVARARCAAQAGAEAGKIAASRKRLEQAAKIGQAMTELFRLLKEAAEVLEIQMSPLQRQAEGNPALASLVRRYEVFMRRYLAVVDQMSFRSDTSEEV